LHTKTLHESEHATVRKDVFTEMEDVISLFPIIHSDAVSTPPRYGEMTVLEFPRKDLPRECEGVSVWKMAVVN
jgi:hypothetical protein